MAEILGIGSRKTVISMFVHPSISPDVALCLFQHPKTQLFLALFFPSPSLAGAAKAPSGAHFPGLMSWEGCGFAAAFSSREQGSFEGQDAAALRKHGAKSRLKAPGWVLGSSILRVFDLEVGF